MDFWISKWISGFLDFRLDFWISDWISGFQIGFPPTVYEIGSHYFHVVSCPLSHDPRGGGAARYRVKAAVRHTASRHKVFVTL